MIEVEVIRDTAKNLDVVLVPCDRCNEAFDEFDAVVMTDVVAPGKPEDKTSRYYHEACLIM